ncbi:YesK family protein [Virgibacillus chiguensis]|uniref:YesK-like protein n=1 Tax=Virgibacillus chiguensis TaxID=411959 RepID=A0A1M5SUE7_9BACI|nr:YesK family protein [Virgibacillus chiguensis]SHH42145.1 YesK-like protein [Virgibacillus chiguensis]
MYRNILEAWWPITLAGIITATIIIVLARYIRRTVLFLLTTLISFVSFLMLLFSIFTVGRWEGLGIGMFSISILVGANVGAICSFFVKQKQ